MGEAVRTVVNYQTHEDYLFRQIHAFSSTTISFTSVKVYVFSLFKNYKSKQATCYKSCEHIIYKVYRVYWICDARLAFSKQSRFYHCYKIFFYFLMSYKNSDSYKEQDQ